jgi:anaerobic selenocysteine-containing dehydrogenase
MNWLYTVLEARVDSAGVVGGEHVAVQETKSFCRACGSACGTIVEVEGDQIVGIRGDTSNALTEGYTCSKGRALAQVHHDPDRLQLPHMRAGVEDALQTVAWDVLLDDLAAKLTRIVAESGPRAVGIFVGGGGYMDASGYLITRRIPKALNTPSVYSDTTIDVISKLVVSEMMTGAPGMMSRADLTRCKLVIYVGTNPLVSHGHTSMLNSPAARLREMMASGEVWVIDPRNSETARRATRHLAPRAGTDYAVFAYLIRELLRDGADFEYLEKHAQDVDTLRKVVERFSIERASAISGTTVSELSDLLAAVRRAGRLCVETGTGISMSPSANVTQWMTWALMIVTGSLDREGGAWINPGFLNQIDRLDIPPAPPTGWPEPGPESRPELRGIAGEYPCAAMSDEIEAGHLRALISFGGNVVNCMMESERTEASLKKLDVLAVLEISQNETTAIATHLLPTKDQFERADLSYGVDTLFTSVAVQYTHPVVAPVGERQSMWWIVAQLGKRMGIDFLPEIDPDTGTDEDVMRLILSTARRGFDEVQANGFTVSEERAFGWLQRYVDEKIGGWRLAPPLLVAQLEAIKDTPPLVLIPRRQRKHANSRFRDLGDEPSVLVSAEDAEEAGLADGSLVLVRSPHGTLKGVMTIDPSLGRGVMSVPHGWAGDQNVNRLTSSRDVDPMTGMPRFSGLPVSLHPAWTSNN